MRKLITAVLLITLVAAVGFAQKLKPWGEWSKKDVEKMINDSPWGQTQTETDTSQMFFSPTSDPNRSGTRSTSNDNSRLNQGATNQAVNLNFRIRFFSAKPIRQAIARMIELNQSSLPKETAEKLTLWANV